MAKLINMSAIELREQILREECDFHGIRVDSSMSVDVDLEREVRRFLVDERCDPRGPSLDFRKSELRGLDIPGWSLGAARLGGAYLDDANLSECSLFGATLDNTQLRGTNLNATYFGGCEFVNAVIIRAKTRGMKVHNCKFYRSLFQHVDPRDMLGLETNSYTDVICEPTFYAEVADDFQANSEARPLYLLMIEHKSGYVMFSNSDKSFIK